MNASQSITRLSTGILGLDELLGGLAWGECVLFHASNPSAFVLFVDLLRDSLGASEIPLQELRVEDLERSQIGESLAFPTLALSETTAEKSPHHVAPVAYCLDDLEKLCSGANSRERTAEQFSRFMAWISRTTAIAYVFLHKSATTTELMGELVALSPIVLDLWTEGDSNYLQIIKAKGRYSEKLHQVYQFRDDEIWLPKVSASDEYTRALELQSREFLELYAQKRRVESDLQRKVFELSLINELTSSLLSTINLKEILQRILVGVTAKEGLGFNRAFLLLVNEKEQLLEGAMAIGPSSLEEAMGIWADLSERHLTFADLLAAFDSGLQPRDVHVNQLIKSIRIPFHDRSNVFIDLLMQTQPEVLGEGSSRVHPGADELLRQFGVTSLAATPLSYRRRQLGLLMADNLINQKPITEDNLHILETFANYASTAIEHSRLYEEVRLRIKESEKHISELKTMQNRLMRSKKLSDLGELASKMAHELRTPLVSIGGFANVVLRRLEPSSPDYESLKIIVDEVRRLEGIIRNVLAYVSPGIPRVQDMELQKLVFKVLKLMETTFAQSRISLQTHVDNNLPSVAVDPEQIQLVLTSIFNNAVESMPNGGRISVSIQHGIDFVRLSISDTGSGIAEQHLNKVFDAFYTTKSLGSGLGLNIASQIIANHKGSIYVESQLGKGSTFFINLPLTSS